MYNDTLLLNLKLGELINDIDGTIVEFGKGKFDEWCVYIKKPEERYAPKDDQIFRIMQNIGDELGRENVYSDFVEIYRPTDKNINPEIIRLISELVNKYRTAIRDLKIGYSVLYGGMVAEENKENAVLGKRIKRLGMHQLLIDGMAPEECAVFSRGKIASVLDGIMRIKGF
jgi:hypothetical protein